MSNVIARATVTLDVPLTEDTPQDHLDAVRTTVAQEADRLALAGYDVNPYVSLDPGMGDVAGTAVTLTAVRSVEVETPDPEAGE